MIGQHTVLMTPDPDVPVWSAPLASNPSMTTNIQGWKAAPFANPWTWSAPGLAVAPAVLAGSGALLRDEAFPVPRDDQDGMYRVRAVVTVSGSGGFWIIPGIYFGTTAHAAWAGPFWEPNNAVGRITWVWVSGPGTYTVTANVDPSEVDPRYTFIGPNVDFLAGEGVTMRPVSIDSIELTRQTFGEQIDITCLIDELTIKHGRTDTTSQPLASTATIDISLDTGEQDIPDGLDVGAIIRVSTQLPDITSTRFVGKVTDVNLGWDDAGADTPEAVVMQVIATGELGDLGRRVVGSEPWAQELDGARVARILAAAGVNLTGDSSDPGTVQINPRDVDAQPALELAQSVANSAGGIVWQTRDGFVRYADANHRRGAVAGLRIDSCDVQVTPIWQRNIDGLVNTVSIGYGVAVEGGEQPRYTATNQPSRDKFGRFELSQATELAELADAEAFGQLLLTRQGFPVWLMSALPVDVDGLADAETVALLSMDVNDLLELTGMPAVDAVPTSTSLWVEGWTERLAYGVHELALNVSGFCRTAPPPQWDAVPDRWTWDIVDAALTWDAVSCLGPQPPQGRWVDVPATTRWDQVANTITWDTWKG